MVSRFSWMGHWTARGLETYMSRRNNFSNQLPTFFNEWSITEGKNKDIGMKRIQIPFIGNICRPCVSWCLRVAIATHGYQSYILQCDIIEWLVKWNYETCLKDLFTHKRSIRFEMTHTISTSAVLETDGVSVYIYIFK